MIGCPCFFGQCCIEREWSGSVLESMSVESAIFKKSSRAERLLYIYIYIYMYIVFILKNMHNI
jgi:hypothetical protein